MDRRFEGKSVLVTGGSRGIGKAIAYAFHHAGARVFICGRDAKSLIRAAREIGEIICVPGDVRKDAARILRAVDRLDVLVNNAGGMEHHEKAPTASAWKSSLELNLLSAVEMTRAALPLLKKSGGTIVNIASDVGRRPFRMGPDYCAAKAALINYTKYLAPELRANVVCPGPVVTGDWSKADIRQAASRTLLKRTGKPEEVADAVLFAAHCGFLNGAVVGVDGGAVRSP
ncbi:MAG TPA: SDR family oxidoreductase [Planctomycetota bacterium]